MVVARKRLFGYECLEVGLLRHFAKLHYVEMLAAGLLVLVAAELVRLVRLL